MFLLIASYNHHTYFHLTILYIFKKCGTYMYYYMLTTISTLLQNGTKPLLSSDVNMNTIAGDPRCENYT